MKRFIIAFLVGFTISVCSSPVFSTELPSISFLPPIPTPEFPMPEVEPSPSVAPATPTTPQPTFIMPTQGIITSNYGWRWGRMHQGVDIGAPIGTPVIASAGGWINFSGWDGGYGNMVEIRHFNGSITRYAHHSRNLVAVGTHVQQGQQIAEVGSTGHSTGPHLHFEIHLAGRGTVNPLVFLPQDQVAASRS